MSHYVIKLKESWSNYLAELPDYNTPQWQPRSVAKHFATAAEARAYLAALEARGLDYPAHVVFLRTAGDLKAERKLLLAAVEAVARLSAKDVAKLPWEAIRVLSHAASLARQRGATPHKRSAPTGQKDEG